MVISAEHKASHFVHPHFCVRAQSCRVIASDATAWVSLDVPSGAVIDWATDSATIDFKAVRGRHAVAGDFVLYVGRSTFYAHFADKETLLASRLEDLRDTLARQQQLGLAERGGAGARGLGFSLPMLEHARSHLPVYRMIVGRESGGFVFQRLHAMIADLAGVGIKALGLQQTPSQRELAVEFIAGAFMAVLKWWSDRGASSSRRR